ncbi:MAG: hypothetical protein HY923_11395 [Elusimicrobia bacterium]|nr:hypothetical protein [Elusimicrobiota bacterium]
MRFLVAALVLACSSSAVAAPMVRSIGLYGGGYLINGLPAAYVGSGDFKEVLQLPADPGLVVKVFYADTTSSAPEMRREVAAIRALEPLAVAPRLVERGERTVRGQAAGYLVQERVRGSTLDNRVTAEKLEHVRALFETLRAAGLELTDTAMDFKLRANIMVGTTRGGPRQAYLVDPAFKASDKTAAQLGVFYDGLLARIARR